MSGQTLLYTAYILIFWSVFYIVQRFLVEQATILAQQNLEVSRVRSRNVIAQLLKPVFVYYIVPNIRQRPFWDNARIKYRRLVIAAGLFDELNEDEFIAFKLILIGFFPFIVMSAHFLEIIHVSWMIVFGSAILGWFYPDLWVNSVVAQRKIQILRSMPFVVDLLALCTESGLDFVGAIGRVSEKANPSPLIDELEQVLREIKVGSSRSEALREMSNRISLSEINSFVAILIASDQLGSPIGRVLKQQSEQIRNDRLTRAEKAGAQAASKLNLPIFLFVLPAAFCMIIGPIVMSFLYGS